MTQERIQNTLGFTGVVLFAIAVVATITAVISTWKVGFDIDRSIVRCQVAGDLERMANCTDEIVQAMEQHEVTEGYVFPLIHDPATDVALDYAALQDISSRARAIAEEHEITAIAYQVALDDMRGTLREIEVVSRDFVAWRHWYSWMQIVGYILGTILLIFAGVLEN